MGASRGAKPFGCHCASPSSSEYVCTNNVNKNLLGAPALDGICEHNLLRVVGNECDKVVNHVSEMSIRTSMDYRCFHAWTQGTEYSLDRCVVQLVLEHMKSCVIVKVMVAWKVILSLLKICLIQLTFWDCEECDWNDHIAMHMPDGVVGIANG